MHWQIESIPNRFWQKSLFNARWFLAKFLVESNTTVYYLPYKCCNIHHLSLKYMLLTHTTTTTRINVELITKSADPAYIHILVQMPFVNSSS